MVSNLKALAIPSFIGGIREDVDHSLLNLNETPNAQNCYIDEGVLGTSKGCSEYISISAPFNSIGTLMIYHTNDKENIIIAAEGSVYKFENNQWISIASGFQSNSWDYVNDNLNGTNVLVLANGVDNVKYYDGIALRDLKKDGKASTESPDNILKGECIDIHYERLWVVDGNNIYFSTANKNGFDIEDFTAPAAPPEEVNQHGGLIVLYSNDSTKTIGLKVIFDDIILYKTKSVWKVTGSTPDTYQKVRIFSAAGAISDKSIVSTESGAFHIDHKGIYFYDGVNVIKISKKLDKTFSNLNRDYLKNAVAAFWNNKYILAVPEGTSAANNLIIEYDIDNKSFMLKRGTVVYSFAEYNNRLLYVGVGNKVYEYGVTDTYAGIPIEMYYETGYSDLTAPNMTKEIESIYFTAQGVGDVKFLVTTEKGTKSKTVTLSNTENPYPINFMHRGRLIKVRFENVNGSVFTLKGFKILYDPDYD